MRSVAKARRWTIASIAAAACLCAAASWAQTYPAKPVRYVVPFPAGSGNDMVGRLLTDQLTRKWGQQVIVENRVGASGTIGAAYIAKSPSDGYTLLHCNIAPNAISPSMMSKLPYEHKDFAPITRIGMPPNIIMVHHEGFGLQGDGCVCEGQPGQATLPGWWAPCRTRLWSGSRRLKFDIVHVPCKRWWR